MKPTPPCELYIDGASRGNPGPSGVGAVVLVEGQAAPMHEFSKFLGQTTNNVAEYLALVYGLLEVGRHGYRQVTVKTDSELLARQMQGRYKVREPHLRLFHDLAKSLTATFHSFEIEHIPRERNRLADRLAGQAADSLGLR